MGKNKCEALTNAKRATYSWLSFLERNFFPYQQMKSPNFARCMSEDGNGKVCGMEEYMHTYVNTNKLNKGMRTE